MTTLEEYAALTPEEKAPYQSFRTCPECGDTLVRTTHSTGDLHVQCMTCHNCPDCEEGE